jgi:hypothetical protein
VKNVYTIGQIAAILGATAPTVKKYVDCGDLAGYRLPQGDRRIPGRALLAFMRKHGIPEDGLEPPPAAVVVVGFPASFTEALTRLLADWDVRTAAGAFTAGVALARSSADVVLLDAQALGRSAAGEVGDAATICGAGVVVRVADDGGADEWQSRGWAVLAADAGPEAAGVAVRKAVRR